MEFKLGELFCGPGGLAVGATRADISDPAWKITHQWATDYDEDTCNTYRQNICPRNPESVIHADIRELDYDRLKELGDIDGLAFGFPCNDFSRMGEHKGLDGDYGPLYTYGAKALKVFQPKWFLAENVGGIRSANEGNAFKQILQTFEDAGYNLVTNLYKFEQYGVPQARHRIIIVGIRKDQNVEFKVPSTEPYKNCDVSAKTALTQPPITNDMTGTELPQTTPTVQERLSYIKPGENVFNANMPEHLRLKVKGATISQLYKRLHPDKPSYTVIGAGGGGTHVYHWKENRALTNARTRPPPNIPRHLQLRRKTRLSPKTNRHGRTRSRCTSHLRSNPTNLQRRRIPTPRTQYPNPITTSTWGARQLMRRAPHYVCPHK